MKKLLKKFIKGEEGGEMIEWGVVLLIAALLIAIAVGISTTLGDKLTNAGNAINSSFGGSGSGGSGGGGAAGVPTIGP